MAKKKRKKPSQYKPALGYSPVQKTASGAGVHEKKGKYKRRNDRRVARQELKKNPDETP